MPDQHDDVVRRLAAACQQGDIGAVRAVLDAGAFAVCDGGELIPTVTSPVHGAENAARLVMVLLGWQPDADVTVESVNGQPGLALRRAGQAIAVIGVTVIDAKAAILWVVLNPAKLRGWHRR
jgi:RNA polymerase sigma-70 factor (ECF subfamily)